MMKTDETLTIDNCPHDEFNGGHQQRCEGCGYPAEYIRGYQAGKGDGIPQGTLDGYDAGYFAGQGARDFEIARLTEALRHYADKENWLCMDNHPHDIEIPCERDVYAGTTNGNGYDIAQSALSPPLSLADTRAAEIETWVSQNPGAEVENGGKDEH